MAVNQRVLQKYEDRRSNCKVLGCLLLNPKLLKSRTDPIDSDYFCTRTHKVLFEVIESLASTGKFETITLGDIENWMYNNAQVSYNKFFETGDESEWILSLIDDADLGSYTYYLDIVRKYAFLRDKIKSGQDVSDILDETQVDLRLLEEQRNNFYNMTLQDIIRHYDRKNVDIKGKYTVRSKEDSRKSGDDAEEIWKAFEESPDYGWRTESRFLDRVARGARRGMFSLESKDSGTGKSRLGVLQLCTLSCATLWSHYEKTFVPNPYGDTVPTLYIGTEMDLRKEIEPIIWATISGVEEHKIKTHTYTDEEKERLMRAIEISKESFIFLENEPNYDIEFLYTMVEEHVLNHNIGAVVIDYIETTPALISEYSRLTRGMGIDEHQVLFNLSVELKNIANRFNVYVKAYTQISDNARRNWEIRDSGAIKGSKSLQMKADLAMVTMRPTEQEIKLVQPIIDENCTNGVVPNIVINVYKNRGGTYGQVRIFAMQNLGNMKFTDLFVTDWDYKQIDPKVLPKLHLKSPELRVAQKVADTEIDMKNVHIVTDEDIKDTLESTMVVDPNTGEIIEMPEEEEVIAKPTRGSKRRKPRTE